MPTLGHTLAHTRCQTAKIWTASVRSRAVQPHGRAARGAQSSLFLVKSRGSRQRLRSGAWLWSSAAVLCWLVNPSVTPFAAEVFTAPGQVPPPAAAAYADAAPTNTAFVTMATLDDNHKLALGDKLSFRIIEDQEDPAEKTEPKPLVVADHGEVEVPYIGRFPAVGKTCRQLAREIKTELEKDYYYRATIIIGLDSLAKSNGRVYVLGEVRVTGAVEIPGDERLTAGKAVLRAGGFTKYSDKRHVKVTREGNPGGEKPSTRIVNLADVLEKGMADKDVSIESGDVIYVPTRLINF